MPDFNDPVLRCDACQKLIKMEDVKNIGLCRHCGNRRVRNLTVFNEEERAQMVEWGIDESFISQFEGVPE